MRKYNTSVFLNEDDISYYLLGLFITDGNVYKSKTSCESTISSIDIDILERIRDLICPDLKLRPHPSNRCLRLRLNNKLIYNWFIGKGCIPNKTKVVKFPQVPDEYLSHFIRGLIDGDGSIGLYKKQGMVRFDSASLDLITVLCEKFNGLGFKCSIKKTKWITTVINGRKTQSTTQMYRLQFSGLIVYKLLKFLYRSDRISIKRKKIKAEQIFARYENQEYTEQELMNLGRLPMRKWKDENELFDLMVRYKGVLKEAAKELGVSAWGLSNHLRNIGIYDRIRELFPIDNIKNLSGRTRAY